MIPLHNTNEAFSESGTLMTHIQTHTGEILYQCTLSNKTYDQSGSFDMHMSPMHINNCSHPHYVTWNIVKLLMSRVQDIYQSGSFDMHMSTHTHEQLFTPTLCNMEHSQAVDVQIQDLHSYIQMGTN